MVRRIYVEKKDGFDVEAQGMFADIRENLHADGLGENDHSAIARYYEKLTGTEIRK